MILNSTPLPSRAAMKAMRPIAEAIIDGKPAVLVTVKDGRQAVVDLDSFLKLWSEGWSMNWRIQRGANGHEFVVTKKRGQGAYGSVAVGRAIMNPGKDYAVRYHGGTFDLRKESLGVVPKEHLAMRARQSDPVTVGRSTGEATRRGVCMTPQGT